MLYWYYNTSLFSLSHRRRLFLLSLVPALSCCPTSPEQVDFVRTSHWEQSITRKEKLPTLTQRLSSYCGSLIIILYHDSCTIHDALPLLTYVKHIGTTYKLALWTECLMDAKGGNLNGDLAGDAKSELRLSSAFFVTEKWDCKVFADFLICSRNW